MCFILKNPLWGLYTYSKRRNCNSLSFRHGNISFSMIPNTKISDQRYFKKHINSRVHQIGYICTDDIWNWKRNYIIRYLTLADDLNNYPLHSLTSFPDIFNTMDNFSFELPNSCMMIFGFHWLPHALVRQGQTNSLFSKIFSHWLPILSHSPQKGHHTHPPASDTTRLR